MTQDNETKRDVAIAVLETNLINFEKRQQEYKKDTDKRLDEIVRNTQKILETIPAISTHIDDLEKDMLKLREDYDCIDRKTSSILFTSVSAIISSLGAVLMILFKGGGK